MAVPLHAKQAQSGGRNVALPTLDPGAIRGWVVSATPWPLHAQKGPGSHCTGGWVASVAVWTVAENFTPPRLEPGPSSP
jgi:hypothetical protein